jgi:hypothetical protein
MSGTLPWGTASPAPMSNDVPELLRRIEQNTASLIGWMKILTAAVVVLVLVTAVLFI